MGKTFELVPYEAKTENWDGLCLALAERASLNLALIHMGNNASLQ